MTGNNAAWFYQADRLLKRTSELCNIKPPQRGIVYRCLRQKLVNKVADTFPILLAEYKTLCETLKVSRWHSDVKVIQAEGMQVLGCLTTGLTKHRGMIATLKPRILIVEEAAEAREAIITSALHPTLHQLVLVGDHRQLVPHVNVRESGYRPYNLHVSLFERLIRLNLPYSPPNFMLHIQRRVISAIRELVHAFYPALEDHESVTNPENRPPSLRNGWANPLVIPTPRGRTAELRQLLFLQYERC